MACDKSPLEFEQKICTVCYLSECVEFMERGKKSNVCPLRVSRQLKLTADQGRQLSRVAQIRQYQPGEFLKMAQKQAEWNQIPAGGL
jgi:hypothetical protein